MRGEIKIGKIYVGDRLLEDLDREEREAFSRRCVERMGGAFTDWYRQHPEELGQLRGIPEWDRENNQREEDRR